MSTSVIVVLLCCSAGNGNPQRPPNNPAEQARIARLKSLCEKYILDYPIRQSAKPTPIECTVIEALIREALSQDHKWVGRVGYDGARIQFSGTRQKNLLGGLKDEQIQANAINEVKLALAGLFAAQVEIVGKVNIDSTGGVGHIEVVPHYDIKPSLLAPDSRLNYPSIWTSIVNAVGKVPGGELDGPTQKTGTHSGFVKTKQQVEEAGGFVTRYCAEITMRRPAYDKDDPPIKGGFHVELEVVLKAERRRASSPTWTEIHIDGRVFGQTKGVWDNPSSNPFVKAILGAVKK